MKSYDPTARLTSVLVGGSQGATITYDGFSRRQSVTQSSGEVGTFQHDLLNRVLAESWGGPTPISESLGKDKAYLCPRSASLIPCKQPYLLLPRF